MVGGVDPAADGRYEVRFRLFDVPKQALARRPALHHHAATRRAPPRTASPTSIYEKLTGDKGVFRTRIAYVVKRGTRFELQVADADGANAQTVLTSNEPIMSPSWSPDGTPARLRLVRAEEAGRLRAARSRTGQPTPAVANFRGINSAPAWSPDGRQPRGGAVAGRRLAALPASTPTARTRSGSRARPAIDTEPAFSPDGQWIYFTSDRGGSPQIYRMSADGRRRRSALTFDGSYNVSPRFSPDGKTLAFVRASGGRFQRRRAWISPRARRRS